MSLRSALTKIPDDRASRGRAGDIVELLRRRGDWMTSPEVAGALAMREQDTSPALTALADGFVLDFHDEPPRYRYRRDPVIDAEVDGFLRRAEGHRNSLQAGIERFRNRVGYR